MPESELEPVKEEERVFETKHKLGKAFINTVYLSTEVELALRLAMSRGLNPTDYLKDPFELLKELM